MQQAKYKMQKEISETIMLWQCYLIVSCSRCLSYVADT